MEDCQVTEAGLPQHDLGIDRRRGESRIVVAWRGALFLRVQTVAVDAYFHLDGVLVRA